MTPDNERASLPSGAVTTPRAIAASLLAVALLITACTGGATPETTTTTSVAPTTTTSAPTTTQQATTTTTEPPPIVEVSGDVPDELAAVLSAALSWHADHRNTAQAMVPGMAAALLEMDLDVGDAIEVTARVAELETGRVAIAVSTQGEVFALADEGAGWRLAGAAPAGRPGWFGAEPRLVLVLGSDARPGQIQQRFRADSVHLLSARASDGDGTILGFPRDSYVASPFGSMKLSSVMAGRGPDVITDVVADEWDLDIEGYVVTGFVGFEGLMGDLGNLPIDLPRSIPAQPWWPGFRSGEQTLTPTRVLEYSRTRKGVPGGDFTRSFNQGVVMLAMLRLLHGNEVLAAPGFLSILERHTWTNLSATVLIQLATTAFLLDPDEVENVVLPGRLGTAGGGSVVFLGDDADLMIADLADDGLLG